MCTGGPSPGSACARITKPSSALWRCRRRSSSWVSTTRRATGEACRGKREKGKRTRDRGKGGGGKGWRERFTLLLDPPSFSFVRQDERLWDALHAGVLTTGAVLRAVLHCTVLHCAALPFRRRLSRVTVGELRAVGLVRGALGLYESSAAKKLGIPNSRKESCLPHRLIPGPWATAALSSPTPLTPHPPPPPSPALRLIDALQGGAWRAAECLPPPAAPAVAIQQQYRGGRPCWGCRRRQCGSSACIQCGKGVCHGRCCSAAGCWGGGCRARNSGSSCSSSSSSSSSSSGHDHQASQATKEEAVGSCRVSAAGGGATGGSERLGGAGRGQAAQGSIPWRPRCANKQQQQQLLQRVFAEERCSRPYTSPLLPSPPLPPPLQACVPSPAPGALSRRLPHWRR